MSWIIKNVFFNRQRLIIFTSSSHSNELQLPMLFIANIAVVFSDNTVMLGNLKWLHKL